MSSVFCAFQDPLYQQHRIQSSPVSVFNSEALLDRFIGGISDDPIVGNSALAQFPNLGNSPDFVNGFLDCPVYGVKMEGSPPSVNGYFSGGEGYGGDAEIAGFLQRSFSGGDGVSYGGGLQGTLFQPPGNGFSNGQFDGHLRRGFSTGDLPMMADQRMCMGLMGSQSMGTFMEDSSFKIGKYSPEEKKEKIIRYKAKRGLRNYNKTIKYACRKTLADSRPRIRGRFARNDEFAENLEMAKSTSGSIGCEFKDDHLVEGRNERGDQGTIPDGSGVEGGNFSSYFGGGVEYDPEFIGYY